MPTDTEEDDYKVGYGKPPKHTQFKKGRSGNSRGGVPPQRPLAESVAAMLNRVTTITVNGKRERVRMQDAFAAAQVQKAIAGDGKAAKLVSELSLRAPPPKNEQPAEEIWRLHRETLDLMTDEEVEVLEKFHILLRKAIERA